MSQDSPSKMITQTIGIAPYTQGSTIFFPDLARTSLSLFFSCVPNSLDSKVGRLFFLVVTFWWYFSNGIAG